MMNMAEGRTWAPKQIGCNMLSLGLPGQSTDSRGDAAKRKEDSAITHGRQTLLNLLQRTKQCNKEWSEAA